jgi:hypothetical protein
MNAKMPVIPRSSSRKVNGYAVLALETVREQRDAPAGAEREALAAAQRLLALIAKSIASLIVPPLGCARRGPWRVARLHGRGERHEPMAAEDLVVGEGRSIKG